eukprot:445815_1
MSPNVSSKQNKSKNLSIINSDQSMSEKLDDACDGDIDSSVEEGEIVEIKVTQKSKRSQNRSKQTSKILSPTSQSRRASLKRNQTQLRAPNKTPKLQSGKPSTGTVHEPPKKSLHSFSGQCLGKPQTLSHNAVTLQPQPVMSYQPQFQVSYPVPAVSLQPEFPASMKPPANQSRHRRPVVISENELQTTQNEIPTFSGSNNTTMIQSYSEGFSQNISHAPQSTEYSQQQFGSQNSCQPPQNSCQPPQNSQLRRNPYLEVANMTYPGTPNRTKQSQISPVDQPSPIFGKSPEIRPETTPLCSRALAFQNPTPDLQNCSKNSYFERFGSKHTHDTMHHIPSQPPSSSESVPVKPPRYTGPNALNQNRSQSSRPGHQPLSAHQPRPFQQPRPGPAARHISSRLVPSRPPFKRPAPFRNARGRGGHPTERPNRPAHRNVPPRISQNRPAPIRQLQNRTADPPRLLNRPSRELPHWQAPTRPPHNHLAPPRHPQNELRPADENNSGRRRGEFGDFVSQLQQLTEEVDSLRSQVSVPTAPQVSAPRLPAPVICRPRHPPRSQPEWECRQPP